MNFQFLKSFLFTAPASAGLLAKLRETHRAIFSAERRRQREMRAAKARIDAHELAIIKARHDIEWHMQAIACAKDELELLDGSRGKQLEVLWGEEREVLKELHPTLVPRETRLIDRLEALESE